MPAKNDQPALERVTYHPRIVSLLQQVYESRTVVTVHLKDSGQRYNSAILEIDPDNNTLLLDELNPRSGHQQLLKTKQINVSARLAGVSIYFKSTVNTIEEENGIALYRIPIPERVLYEQKRGAFRVRISAGIIINTTLKGEGQMFEGTITDISSTGIGALIEANEDDIKTHTKFECRLIPEEGHEPLSCELEVRFAKLDEKTKQMRVGGQFVNATPQLRNQMERFVMALQREIIKRQRNT